MQPLTPQGQHLIEGLAQRYGTSTGAVLNLLDAVMAGNGSMAQFNHPELGGSGQWMQGGMTMVGDMFNNALKCKVDGLCNELSQLLMQSSTIFVPASYQSQSQGNPQHANVNPEVSLFVSSAPSNQWWPADLGVPSTTGAQNSVRYAYFPATRRLAIEVNGQVTLYDTLDHQISGVSQQQSGDASVTFTSQFGLIALSSLPVLSPGGTHTAEFPVTPSAEQSAPGSSLEGVAGTTSNEDIFGTIERLAKLHKKGILSEQEFAAKKAELLSRL
ncbi:MAG TPA: SHOCT domain-containing protein [Candidatus Competibacteraceae bacterium]|nr:SHOCT domain-containing protein [Candidatus Competibacteraceae bacterium]